MRCSSIARRQYGTLMTQMRSMKASLLRLFLKPCHSASFECARMMPWKGMAPMFSEPM